MPDKRQQSKQRRAARNRANREALAARREAAAARAAAAASPRSAGDTATGRGGGAAPAAGGPPPRGLGAMLRAGRPGDKALLVALALTVLPFIYLLFSRVPVDDRGEPWPQVFTGLAKAARERLTGEPAGDETANIFAAYGPAIILLLAIPLLVMLFALWANRRPDRGRMLTFAMLAMAGAVIVTQMQIYLPAMIALAVAGFQARKADLPAQMAERAARAGAGGGRGRRGAIDVDSEEVDTSAGRGASAGEADDDAGIDDAGPVDDEAAGPPDEVEYDPLAELEAEIEAERASGEGDTGAGDAGDDGEGGGRRRRRGR